MVLIYYTPSLINNNGDIKVPVYYYCLLALIFAVSEVITYLYNVFRGEVTDRRRMKVFLKR